MTFWSSCRKVFLHAIFSVLGGQCRAKWLENVSKYLNAELKPLIFHTFHIHNARFKGLYACLPYSWKTIPKADGCKATVSLGYGHSCPLTFKSTKKDSAFEFLYHSDKPPTVLVPPGLHKAVRTNVASSTSQHPSITSLQWPQSNRPRTRRLLESSKFCPHRHYNCCTDGSLELHPRFKRWVKTLKLTHK